MGRPVLSGNPKEPGEGWVSFPAEITSATTTKETPALRTSIVAGAAAGAFLISAAGTAMLLPRGADAADPTPAPAATAPANPSTTTAPPAAAPNATGSPAAGQPGWDGNGGRGGHHGGMDADDVTAAAKVLGMTDAQLTAQLQAGQSVAQVAKAKGVDIQKVIDAIVAADKEEIAAAVKAGTMTQAQADQRLANLDQHVTDEVNGTGFGGGRADHGGPGGLDADDLTAAAKALGMSESDLTTAVEGGKSVAQVAKDKGVDVQKVIDAIVASDTAEFAAAVKAGTMTQAQADQMTANLAQHVTDEVNGTGGGRGGHGGRDHGGFDGNGGGQQPAASPSAGSGTGA